MRNECRACDDVGPPDGGRGAARSAVLGSSGGRKGYNTCVMRCGVMRCGVVWCGVMWCDVVCSAVLYCAAP
jgi:hypothetical protein